MTLLLNGNISTEEFSDGQLAQKAIDGDETAFATLEQRYHAPLFYFLYNMLNDYDSASEVLQKVMVQLYCYLPRLHQNQSFKAWLFRVAHNRAVDEMRSWHCLHFSELENHDAKEEAEFLLIPDQTLPPQEWLEQRELQQQLQQVIEQLPAHYQQIVLLRYLAQYTFGEISRLTGMHEATVKTYFHRAKVRLRNALQAEHVYELLPGC